MVNNDHYNTYRSRKGIPVEHTCDRSKLPAGTVILKVMKPKVVRTVVNLIEEHHFEVLKVKYSDGSIRQGAVLDLSSASTWWALEGANGL